MCTVLSAYADRDIWTKADLAAFRDEVNSGNTYEGKTVRLMADIDIASSDNWVPIGLFNTSWDETQNKLVPDETCVFKGTFDGQGYTINIDVNSSMTVLGLFGYLYGTVEHLKVNGSVVNGHTATTSSTAGIAAYNKGTISQCANLANIVGVYAGGIAGENHGIIQNCYNQGYIGATNGYSGTYYLGGIAGNNDKGSISYVYADCTMENVSTDAGIVANYISGELSKCFFNSDLYDNEHGTPMSSLTGNALDGQLNTSGVYSIWTFTDGQLPELTCFVNKIVRLLDNDDKGANSTILSSNTKVCTVELNGRTLYKDGDWNTLCLPFNVNDISTSCLAGATIMEMDKDGKYKEDDGQWKNDNVNGDHQTGFDPKTGSLNIFFKNATAIEAGKPYIIKWASDTDLQNPVFYGVTISVTINNENSTTVTASNLEFIGSYSNVTLPAGDPSNLYLGTANALYYPGSKAKTMNACRAYFHVNLGGADGIRAFNLQFCEDEASAIDGIAVNPQPSALNPDVWYSLDGRAFQGKPTTQGVYINQGKKVFIK